MTSISDTRLSGKSFVTVRSAIAPLLADAKASATMVSQILRGHTAEVVDRAGVWIKLRGHDGYEGWCHEGYLDFTPPIFDSSLPSPASGWVTQGRMSLGCIVTSAAQSKSVEKPVGGVQVPNPEAFALPLGALLKDSETTVSGLAMNRSGRERFFAADGGLLVERAKSLFNGTPYLWGGITPWGADCSGMVQSIYALHGTQLPRDAWQQAQVGLQVTSENVNEFHPGDLLYFSDRPDGHITHVVISCGGARVIHSSLANGGFGENDLGSNDSVAANLRATFRLARRVL